MIVGSMDESSQGGQVMAVGTYVGSRKRWLRLTKRWFEVLGTVPFHMTDCEAEPRRGDFKDWM